jgi:hypothetical protein
MGDPQVHPDPHERSRATTDPGATNGARGRLPIGGILAIVLVIALVVLMVVLHLTGTIGPGSH